MGNPQECFKTNSSKKEKWRRRPRRRPLFWMLCMVRLTELKNMVKSTLMTKTLKTLSARISNKACVIVAKNVFIHMIWLLTVVRKSIFMWIKEPKSSWMKSVENNSATWMNNNSTKWYHKNSLTTKDPKVRLFVNIFLMLLKKESMDGIGLVQMEMTSANTSIVYHQDIS